MFQICSKNVPKFQKKRKKGLCSKCSKKTAISRQNALAVQFLPLKEKDNVHQ